MDEHAVTIKTARAGPVCTLIPGGDLDLSKTARFPAQAALASLDCAGVRAPGRRDAREN